MSSRDNDESGSEDADAGDDTVNTVDADVEPGTKRIKANACQACRRMKIKCEPLENQQACKQCAKTKRECVMSSPRRKRQKTAHRVADLESKIEALMASLQQETTSSIKTLSPKKAVPVPMPMSVPVPPAQPSLVQQSTGRPTQIQNVPSRPYDFPPPGAKRKWAPDDTAPYVDVIERGIIDEDTASLAFQRYHGEMCKSLPFVVFPATTTARDIRFKRPLVFLAILNSSIRAFRPDLQPVLSDELCSIIAERVFYRADRSFELLQAMVLFVTFYNRPQHQKDLNFNQIVTSVSTMAIDLGLGRRSKKGVYAETPPSPGVSVIELRRAWLGCYFMGANASMAQRYPIYLRWSPYIEETLAYLTTSPDALPTDAWLVDMVRLQHIAEEVGFMFSMDDPASSVSLTDQKTVYHIKSFEHQLEQWEKNARTDLKNPRVKHMANVINLYIHEIAIHFDHNIDDFRPPSRITEEQLTRSAGVITPAHIDSLTTCLSSIHKTFDSFLELDVEAIRSLPTLFFVRNSYACVALIKLHGVLHAKNSKMGFILASDLKVEPYLDAMIDNFEKAGADDRSPAAFAFGGLIAKLKGWYLDGVKRRAEEEAAESVPVKQDRSVLQPQSQAQSQAQPEMMPTQKNDWTNTQNLDVPYLPEYTPSTIADATMFNLGIPQFYNFGFTFDESEAAQLGDLGADVNWMSYPMQ